MKKLKIQLSTGEIVYRDLSCAMPPWYLLGDGTLVLNDDFGNNREMFACGSWKHVIEVTK